MGETTDRPDSTVFLAYFVVIGGSADADDALRDNLDSTYLDTPGQANSFDRAARVGFPNTAIPADSVTEGVRLRMRARDDQAWPYDSQLGAKPYNPSNGQMGTGVVSTWGRTTITDYSGPYEAARPGGGRWTQTDLDNFQAMLTSWTNYGGGGRIYSIHRDIKWNMAPTVVPSMSSSTQTVVRPLFTWTYDDTELDPQTHWRAKVFTAAQYGAGGFNPESSAAFWDSGWVASGTARSGQVGADLPNDTYRLYMRVRQSDIAGEAHYSSWTSTGPYYQFSVNSTPPAAPGLTATADQTNAWVAVVITKQNTQTGTEFAVEISDDGGVTWGPHPDPAWALIADNGVGSGVALPTLYDQESYQRTTRSYRAKAMYLGATSAWSTVRTATVTTNKWWLKDVIVRTRSMSVEVADFKLTAEEPQGETAPLGADDYHIESEGVRKPRATITLRTKDKTSYDKLTTLLSSGRALLLQDVFGRQWYFKAGSSHSYSLVVARDTSGTYPIRHLHEVSFSLTPTRRPVA